MTTMPDDAAATLPGRPLVVDLATWQAARDELLIRGRPIPARESPRRCRRRLPMVEIDGTVEVAGPRPGPVQ